MIELLRLANIVTYLNNGAELEDINLTIFSGEIICLVGVHGSGKYIIKSVLNGTAKIKSGSFFLNENVVEDYDSATAFRNGIISTDSESSLAEDLNIGENIFALRRYNHLFNPFYFNDQIVHIETEKLLDDIGLDYKPTTRIFELSPFQKHLICLLKALSCNAKLIILDYISNSYSYTDFMKLREIIKKYSDRGVSFLIIDEKPNDLIDISDRVIVMRDLCCSKVLFKEDINKTNIVKYMAGGTFQRNHKLSRNWEKNVLMKFNNKSGKTIFSLHRGQILGFYDMEWDSSRSFLGYLSSLTIKNSAEWIFRDRSIIFYNEKYLNKRKIIYIPETSPNSYLGNLSLGENLAIPIFKKISGYFGIVNSRMMSHLEKEFNQYIKPENASTFDDFSQASKKIFSIYRWVLSGPEVLLLENPLLYIDAMGIQLLTNYLFELAAGRLTIIIFSKDYSELLDTCNYIICTNNAYIRSVIDSARVPL